MAKFTLGTKVFPSKGDARKAVSEVLQRPPASSFPFTLSGEDHDLIFALLRLHPVADKKIGCGVASFYIQWNEYGSRGFYFRRIDGTSSDFGIDKCFNHKPKGARVRQAFRVLIRPQIQEFVNLAFIREVRCAETGVVLSRADAHVDHKYPKTFQRLAEMFAEAEGMSLDEVQTKPMRDHVELMEFVDEGFAARWQAFHKEHADLRIVLDKVNLRGPR